MNFFTSLRSELRKTKRTWILYLCFIAAALIPVLSLLFNGSSPESVAKLKVDPWQLYLKNGVEVLSLVVLPLYVALLCTLLPQIEYRNGTWKQVLSSPQKLHTIFFAKFITVQLYVLTFLICHNLLMILSLIASHVFKDDLQIWNRPFDVSSLLSINARTYVSVLAVSAAQFWFGMRFKSFLAPIGFAFALWFTSMMMAFDFKWPHVDKFPFAYPMITIVPSFKDSVTFILWSSAGYALLFLLIGFIDFNRGKLKV